LGLCKQNWYTVNLVLRTACYGQTQTFISLLERKVRGEFHLTKFLKQFIEIVFDNVSDLTGPGFEHTRSPAQVRQPFNQHYVCNLCAGSTKLSNKVEFFL